MGSVRLNNGHVEIAMEKIEKEESNVKDFKAMLKQDIEAEFSDWYTFNFNFILLLLFTYVGILG